MQIITANALVKRLHKAEAIRKLPPDAKRINFLVNGAIKKLHIKEKVPMNANAFPLVRQGYTSIVLL